MHHGFGELKITWVPFMKWASDGIRTSVTKSTPSVSEMMPGKVHVCHTKSFLTSCFLFPFTIYIFCNITGKFEHPLNQFFLECMQDLVFKLKSDKALKATFRLAACNLALQRPGSTDCLHYVLHHADAPSEDDSDDHSDSGGDNAAAAASDGGET